MPHPQPGPQTQFLKAVADIVIYGGMAYGGKSWGLLADPIYRQHIQNPQFGAVIFRRTYPQIRNEGGLWDESLKMYPDYGATPRESTVDWRFPSGATVAFRHLEYDKNVYDWQGSQIAALLFDELTHFSEFQFFYMLSRNRSTCGIKPYVRGTCNPDADSWVANFISWWINQESGLAIPERAGVVRWFARINDHIQWGDSKAELQAQYPASEPKSLTFIPASIYDNKIGMDLDPGYLANLMALPLVDRERLLGGNWKIKPAAGKVFNRGWFKVVDAVPAGGREVRFWDFAATEKKLKGDPDYTAGVKMRQVGVGDSRQWYILDVINAQIGPAETDRTMLNTASQDGKACHIAWEEEGGASGVRDSARLTRMLAGYICQGVRSESAKIVRAKGLASQAEAGNVFLVRGDWNERFLSQLHSVPDGAHDDMMDGASGAFNQLVNGISTFDDLAGLGSIEDEGVRRWR